MGVLVRVGIAWGKQRLRVASWRGVNRQRKARGCSTAFWTQSYAASNGASRNTLPRGRGHGVPNYCVATVLGPSPCPLLLRRWAGVWCRRLILLERFCTRCLILHRVLRLA